MTYKINVIMLRKNRTVEYLKVHPDDFYFKRRGNLYMIPKEAVNSVCFEFKSSNPHAELIYVEGDPIPQSIRPELSGDTFLDHLVIENAIKNTAQSGGFFLDVLKDYLHSPGKIMMLVFALIVLIAFLGGWLHWF